MTESMGQKVIVACRRLQSEREDVFQQRYHELVGLCEAAGGTVLASFVQVRSDVDRGLYLGSGKILDIRNAVESMEADLVVFDGELSPGQIRNLEVRLDCRVIDRTQLILDIFAGRAQSKEGRLQVEIAQLRYLMPRLTGRGVELSRLGGGIGTRGPGETKLETDRRRIRQRIDHLQGSLKQIQKSRITQRVQRSKTVPVVALVGYTNAGKSTVLQHWTADKGVKREERGHDRLFDTLDPLARRVRCGPTSDIVLLDTVGFVQDLPHLLVEAFRATLEEALSANLILHVVDGSQPFETHVNTTYQVLKEIGALDKPIVTFYNKMDIADTTPPPDMQAVTTLYGSAWTGLNMEELYDEVERQLQLDRVNMVIEGPASQVLDGRMARYGTLLDVREVDGHAVSATFEIARSMAPEVARLVASEHALRMETDILNAAGTATGIATATGTLLAEGPGSIGRGTVDLESEPHDNGLLEGEPHGE